MHQKVSITETANPASSRRSTQNRYCYVFEASGPNVYGALNIEPAFNKIIYIDDIWYHTCNQFKPAQRS